MKLMLLFLYFVISFSLQAQISSFKTTIDYYLLNEDCFHYLDTFKRNGLPEISESYLDLAKNDEEITKIHDCEGLQVLIIDNIKKGNIKAFDIDTNKPLDSIELSNLLYKTIVGFDYELGYIEIPNVLKVKELRLFRIIQDWEIRNDFSIHNKISSIVLLQVDEGQKPKPLFKIKFDNEYVEEKLLNIEKNSYIVKEQEFVSKTNFNIHKPFTRYLLDADVPKYDCSSKGLFNKCDSLNNEKKIKGIFNNLDGYILNQYFYFDNVNYSLNSQFISMSGFEILYDEKGKFKYFNVLPLCIKNRNID